MKLHKIITGPIFLLLFIFTAPLQWILMQAFGYVCKLHNWVTRKMMGSLMKEE